MSVDQGISNPDFPVYSALDYLPNMPGASSLRLLYYCAYFVVVDFADVVAAAAAAAVSLCCPHLTYVSMLILIGMHSAGESMRWYRRP